MWTTTINRTFRFCCVQWGYCGSSLVVKMRPPYYGARYWAVGHFPTVVLPFKKSFKHLCNFLPEKLLFLSKLFLGIRKTLFLLWQHKITQGVYIIKKWALSVNCMNLNNFSTKLVRKSPVAKCDALKTAHHQSQNFIIQILTTLSTACNIARSACISSKREVTR